LNFNINRGLPLISLLWSFALLAAFAAVTFKGVSAIVLLPFLGAAIVPALISLMLWPFSDREWVQMLVVFSWITLAIIACFAIGFVPMAILFLCAPAVAVIFEREKVGEAMVFAAIFAAGVFYFGKFGLAPDPFATADQASWGGLSAITATIAFMLSAMFFTASGKEIAAEEPANVPTNVPAAQDGFQFAEAYTGAVVKYGTDGNLLMATPTARTMFGIADAQIEQSSLASLGLDDEQKLSLEAAFTTLRETGERTSVSIDFPESLAAHTNAPSQHMDITLVPQMDGSVFAFTTDCSRIGDKIRNLTDAQACSQIESAKKEFDEKTLFFAGVSHELRTPLNAIIGFSDMMRSRLFGPLPGKYGEYADMIHDSGQHMLDLVGDVLDMSKVEANKYALTYCEFDVADVVRSSMKMVRPSADAAELTLDADIEADLDLIIEADRRAVRQILLNLLSNAIKFTPKGGRVTSSAHINDDRIEIGVADTGTGMTAEDIAAIGTPYTQAANSNLVKLRSTGLGLSLVKNLVNLHGGDFSIASHPGVGTKALVSLPLKKRSEPNEPTKPNALSD